MAKYFVDLHGNYIGAFDGAEPNCDQAIEVPHAPDHGRQVWDGSKWLPYNNYVEKRNNEYPPVGDQLDAILKEFLVMRESGVVLSTELDIIIDKWLAVKANHPK